MRLPYLKILRIVIPLLTLVLLYGGLFRLTIRQPRLSPRVVPTLTPQESQELLSASSSLLNEGKYQEALQVMLKLHDAYPENHVYISKLADIYDHLGRYKEESDMWEQYLDHAPRPMEACPQIGQAYWKQGVLKEKEAISAFERCLSFDPSNSDSIFYLAHALEMAGQFDRAGELYQRGLTLSPKYTDLRLGLARVWLQQDMLEKAKESALGVLGESPDKVDALLIAGLVDAKQGNLGEAKKFLERGAKLSPGYTDFHIALAKIAEQEKNTAEAIRQYNKILELHPEYRDIRARRDALAAKKR
jgi:tetratricopeptide (TPR) repeat protein